MPDPKVTQAHSDRPSTSASRSLQEAVRQHPGKMTLQLARELNVPEVEILRALGERAVELKIGRWEELIRRLEEAGSVRVLLSNRSATMESVGRFGGFSTTGEYFNVQTASLDLHLRFRELASVFAVEKPGHMDGRTTHSIQFFDYAGAAAFKVFFSFGEPISAERQKLFDELRQTFRITAP